MTRSQRILDLAAAWAKFLYEKVWLWWWIQPLGSEHRPIIMHPSWRIYLHRSWVFRGWFPTWRYLGKEKLKTMAWWQKLNHWGNSAGGYHHVSFMWFTLEWKKSQERTKINMGKHYKSTLRKTKIATQK